MMTSDLKPYPAYKDSGVEWLGEVPTHWEVRRLKQICRLAYGDTLTAEMRQDGMVPVFGSNGCVGFHSLANTKAPCIVVGRKGSFGKVNYSRDSVYAIDTTFFIDSRFSEAHIRWLFFLLGWLRLDKVTKDSAVPGLDREDAYQRLAPLPPFPEQTAIVRFLDHADRRIRRYIRAKQKLIALLEEQKQAIIHQAVTGQIDVRTGQPYSSYKDSGVEWLGDVPEHWEISRVKTEFHCLNHRRIPLSGTERGEMNFRRYDYPGLAVRELVANALIHQDFLITGAGPMVEIFEDRIEITNPGVPLVDTQRFVDSPPRSRNEALASFMRRIGICEERGSGWDKVVFLSELNQLPAPLAEVAGDNTRVVLFAPRPLSSMNQAERVRATYLHACLRYVNREYLTNTSVRKRFGIEVRNSAKASRLISEAVQEGAIVPDDPKAAPKLMRYVPWWTKE